MADSTGLSELPPQDLAQALNTLPARSFNLGCFSFRR
jgi:hypothetical protein